MKKAVIVTNSWHRDYPFGTPIFIAQAHIGVIMWEAETSEDRWLIDFANETITVRAGIGKPMRKELLEHYRATFGMEYSS